MQEYTNIDYFTLDLIRVIKIIWKNRLKIIVSSFVISLFLALYMAMFLPYKYEASTKIYLSSYKEKYQFNNQILSELKSKDFINNVIKNKKLNITSSNISKDLVATLNENDKSISIKYKNKDSKLAYEVVVALRDEFIDKVKQKLSVSKVDILENAKEESNSSPLLYRFKVAIICFLAILAIEVIYFFLKEILNDKVVTPNDIKYDLGIDLIGIVPKK